MHFMLDTYNKNVDVKTIDMSAYSFTCTHISGVLFTKLNMKEATHWCLVST